MFDNSIYAGAGDQEKTSEYSTSAVTVPSLFFRFDMHTLDAPLYCATLGFFESERTSLSITFLSITRPPFKPLHDCYPWSPNGHACVNALLSPLQKHNCTPTYERADTASTATQQPRTRVRLPVHFEPVENHLLDAASQLCTTARDFWSACKHSKPPNSRFDHDHRLRIIVAMAIFIFGAASFNTLANLELTLKSASLPK